MLKADSYSDPDPTINQDNRMVQLHVKVDSKTRDELKILAIRKGISMNDLVSAYINHGLRNDMYKIDGD